MLQTKQNPSIIKDCTDLNVNCSISVPTYIKIDFKKFIKH